VYDVARGKAKDVTKDRYKDLYSDLYKEQLGEALRDLVADKFAEKAAKKNRSAAKERLQAETLDMITERIRGLEPWTRAPRTTRRPRLSRDDLAAAAVRIADAEGIDALSMRRLATELDVGTMTLYHYIETKDELLAVLVDAVMGEVVLPSDEPLPDTWRDALTVIARRSRASCERHPWMLDIRDSPPFGPNSVRHFDQSLEAVSSLDVPLRDKVDIVSVVDEYVFGYSLMARNEPMKDPEVEDGMLDYLSVLLDTGAYPYLQSLASERGLRSLWRDVHSTQQDDARFERNLGRVLDGIEQSLPTT
jgi:AcrR family transcriptional regulator